MKELDYITKNIEHEFEVDETITDIDKTFIKGKILAAKYKIEEEMLQFKRDVCHECVESLCPKKESYVLHCMSSQFSSNLLSNITSNLRPRMR